MVRNHIYKETHQPRSHTNKHETSAHKLVIIAPDWKKEERRNPETNATTLYNTFSQLHLPKIVIFQDLFDRDEKYRQIYYVCGCAC